ncbi:MAG: polysaccharide biosynthesis C-terminal domain-containing protein [Atopobiaceae bacterium]|nr:polysaccharide biosynthesis C-terminal domain-containing protein [Atopobiaceae bacterium]
MAHDDARIRILAEEKPAKAVVKLGVPLIAGMCIMVLYNLVDTYFIGLLHDDYQLAAVNLAYPVMMVMIALSNMVGTGAGSLIARSLGAGDRTKADHTLTSAFLLTVVNSAIVAAVGMALLPQIVGGLGAQENTFGFTQSYVRVLLLGSLLVMGNYTFGQLLRSEGSVRQSVAGMVVGTVANIVLDPVFIFVLGGGVEGAAFATVLGNAGGLATSLFFYLRGSTLLKPQASLIPRRLRSCARSSGWAFPPRSRRCSPPRPTSSTTTSRSCTGSSRSPPWASRRRSSRSAATSTRASQRERSPSWASTGVRGTTGACSMCCVPACAW